MAFKYAFKDVAQLQNRSIFVDANVLIYLFWATGSSNWEIDYARIFRALLNQKNEICTDFLILSEVVNRIVRIEHKKTTILHYKDFRNSLKGQETLQDIYTIVQDEILTRFKIIEPILSKPMIENCLVLDELDFMDKATVHTCQKYELVLLTNDKDFKNTDLEILTSNPAILR